MIAKPTLGNNRGEAIAVAQEGSKGLASLGHHAKVLASVRCSLSRACSLAGDAPCRLCSGDHRMQDSIIIHMSVPVHLCARKKLYMTLWAIARSVPVPVQYCVSPPLWMSKLHYWWCQE